MNFISSVFEYVSKKEAALLAKEIIQKLEKIHLAFFDDRDWIKEVFYSLRKIMH